MIVEQIEAWQYGPVVRRLYEEFRRFGSSPITRRAREYVRDADGSFSEVEPRLQVGADSFPKQLVGAVWEKYGKLEPFKLVELAHASGSPWQQAYEDNRRVIPTASIRGYFKSLVEANG